MLRELYDYAAAHQLAVRPGFKPKTPKAYVCLGRGGQLLGIDPPPAEPVLCPDIGSAAQGPTKCNPLVEKASISLGAEKPQKHAFFMQTLAEGAVYEPLFEVLRTALTCPETVEAINAALAEHKIKPGELIGYKVDGDALEGLESWQDWWCEYAAAQKGGAAGRAGRERCLITGELVVPAATVPKVPGLRAVGGHSSGDAVLCFDKDSFCSYNRVQGANAPVSEEAITAVNAALNDLLNRQKAPALAGARWLHWYKRSLPQEEDDCLAELFDAWGGDADADDAGEAPTAETAAGISSAGKAARPGPDEPQLSLFDPLPVAPAPAAETLPTPADAPLPNLFTEAEARREADSLLHGVYTGSTSYGELDNEYYILALSGAGGRMMVRAWQQGSFAQLQRAMNAWWEDLALVSSNGRSTLKRPKLGWLSIRLLKPQNGGTLSERMTKELAALEPQMILAILNGGPLPDQAAAKALQTIRSKMLSGGETAEKREPVPDAIACQLLKAWLRRKKFTTKGGCPMQPQLNPEYPSAAYHCGRMMAVYAAIQARALGNVGAGVLQRYYTSASTTPALVLGRLSSLCQHHLAKLDNPGLARWYEGLLGEIAQSITPPLPATLDLRGQSEFALGYYQQCAALSTPRKEQDAPAGAAPKE